MVNAGIVGVTGFAGEQILEILLRHHKVRISILCSHRDKAQPIADFLPRFKKRLELVCYPLDAQAIANKADLFFLALPHTVSMDVVPVLIRNKRRVIDLSADYRLRDTRVYEKFYSHPHRDKIGLSLAVYGLPELNREKIKNAQLVANPGCYPTCAILALAPILSCCLDSFCLDTIIIDAKSGVTGAGRKVVEELLFTQVNEDFKAYKVNTHQHMPEIDQELSKIAGKRIKTTFVPHLLPLNRGILETIYLKKDPAKRLKVESLHKLYKNFYKTEPFVRIRPEGEFPRLRDVVGTNFCDLGIYEQKDLVIIIGAIDNLLKGASGQAVQNMNIMCGFTEEMGLR